MAVLSSTTYIKKRLTLFYLSHCIVINKLKSMILIAKSLFCQATVILIFTISFPKFAFGIDLNSFIPSANCYTKEQPNCNERLIDKYPEVAYAVTNVTEAETSFLLFTRKNRDDPEKLHMCGGSLPPNSNFNPDNGLIVVLPPFLIGLCEIAVHRQWIHQFLDRGDNNVLALDYIWGTRLEYPTAILNAKYIIATQLRIVLRNIQKATGLLSSKIYMVGHSLGAQIAGIVGKDIHPGRITGVDPAGPGFREDVPLDERLDSTDAEFVDVWHCNAGDCLPNFGINYNAGHVDYWINGGSKQYSCYKYGFESYWRGDFIYATGTFNPTTCYHSHCAVYYMVSIVPNGCQFIGVLCNSEEDYEAGKCSKCGKKGENCAIMGYDGEKYRDTSNISHKKYYVHTGDTCPFCDNSSVNKQGFESTYEDSIKQ